MKVTKKIMAIAAAGVLTALTAVPAFALENEFHGMFALRGVMSNYVTGFQIGPILFPGTTKDSATTNTWFEQRARLFYTAKANDDLKLVTGFEIDANWGRSSYTDGRNQGGALGADTASIENKWVYLDFNIPSTQVNVKGGVQGLNDAYKSVFVGGGADAAGLLVSSPVGPSKLTAGWFRLDDRQADGKTSNGKLTRDLVILDAKCTAVKDVTVGASYYFLNSDNSILTTSQATTTGNPGAVAGAAADYNVHVLGLNAATKLGDATIDGFFLYEFGTADKFLTFPGGTVTKKHVNSFAANLAGKVKAGPGTAKISALYVNGGTNAFVNVSNESSAAFSENNFGNAIGNVQLLARNPFLTQTESAIVYDSSNAGMGIIGGSVGYDANITSKLFAGANAAFAAVAKSQSGRNSKFQGTELNAEIGYKMYDALTVGVKGAYVILGDFYKGTGNGNSDPADPYITQAYMSYMF